MRILGSVKLPPGPVTMELLQAGQARERAISGDSSRRHCLIKLISEGSQSIVQYMLCGNAFGPSLNIDLRPNLQTSFLVVM